MRYASGDVVSTLLLCHANGDYEAALAEIDRFLHAHYVRGWTSALLSEFSMQPTS